jgi:hypothetical protein
MKKKIKFLHLSILLILLTSMAYAQTGNYNTSRSNRSGRIKDIKNLPTFTEREAIPNIKVFIMNKSNKSQKRKVGITNQWGKINFSKELPNKFKSIKKEKSELVMYVRIPKKYYRNKLKASKTNLVGIEYELQTNNGEMVYKIIIGKDEWNNPASKYWTFSLRAQGGPYSQSFSNLEDNAINIEIPLEDIDVTELIKATLKYSEITLKKEK